MRTNKEKVLYTLNRKAAAKSAPGMLLTDLVKYTHLDEGTVKRAVTSLKRSGVKVINNKRTTGTGRTINYFQLG